ncbi:MAG TPA: tetratricopeptide repeat protein, partial [bacterium]|nr:tetratricopeptide repeat protein [bacterium]
DLTRQVAVALNLRLRRRLLFVDVLDVAECDVLTLLVVHNLLNEARSFSFVLVFNLPPVAALARARRPQRDELAYRYYLILELTVRTKQWSRANDLFAKLLHLRRKLTSPRLLGLMHFRAGMVYVRQGQLPRALAAYQHSRRLLAKINDQENLVKVHNNIGNIYIDLRRYRAALREFSRSLAIAEEFQNDYSLAVTYSSMGTALLQLGDAAAAVDCQKKSLLFVARSGYFSRLQIGYNCLASAYSALGRRAEAERLFSAAYDFAVAENELYDQYAITLAMARHHLVTGATERCREALAAAQRLCRAFDNRFGLMQVQELWGDLATTHRRWRTAATAYRRAQALARELRQPRLLRALAGKLARAERRG